MNLNQLRIDYLNFINSKEYENLYRSKNSKPWKRYIFSVFFIVNIITAPIGIWLIVSGIRKHKKINKTLVDERINASISVPTIAHLVMSNSSLRETKNCMAPALVIASTDPKFTDLMAEEIMIKSAQVHYDSSDVILKKEIGWINDETFVENRKRPIPKKITGGVEVFAFDLMIDTSLLEKGILESSVIPVMVSTARDGKIRIIPFHILELQKRA